MRHDDAPPRGDAPPLTQAPQGDAPPAVRPAALPDDIARMSAYCTYCPKMCRFSCPASAAESRETVTPWGMMRLLELTRDQSVAISPQVAETFYHCTGCRRCQAFCRHDNDVPRALWSAREQAAEAGLILASLTPLRESFAAHSRPYPDAVDWRPDPDIFDDEATVGFWPDCDTLRSNPTLIDRLGRLLHRLLGQKVRLIGAGPDHLPVCCGFPLGATGDRPALDHHLNERWPSLDGLTDLYTDCPALRAWADPGSSWPELSHGDPERLKPTHLVEVLADAVGQNPPPEKLDLSALMVHHSCMMTRQAPLAAPSLKLLRALGSGEPTAMMFDGVEAECCGGQAVYRALEPDAARRQATRVAEQLHHHPTATRQVSTAATCACALGEAREDLDITSLLELVCEAYAI